MVKRPVVASPRLARIAPLCLLALSTVHWQACSGEDHAPGDDGHGHRHVTPTAVESNPFAATTYPAIDFTTRPSYIANNVLGLSFDDGPDSANTPRVLDVLKAKNVKATFFINTNNFEGPVESNTTLKNIIKRIVNEGHQLASHTARHLSLPSLTAAQIEKEITDVQAVVNRSDVLGAGFPKITLLRAPFGDGYTGGQDAKVAPVVAKYAVHIGWAIDTVDYNCTGTPAQKKACVYNKFVSLVKTPGTGDYGQVLMHSVQPQTADAIGDIIDYAQSKGFVFKLAEDFVVARFGQSSHQLVYGGSCTPESNATFCSRLAKNCGSVTANDNCGVSRTVSSCGSCTSPQTCGGGGTPNVCGAPAACNQTPFGGTARAIPGTIQAEDFDNGGNTCAYNDTTTANQGGQYRTSEQVDIQVTTDAGGGHNIGYVIAGEWLEYTVNVASAANYKLELRSATTATGKTVDVLIDNALIANDVAIPNTGNYQTFANATVPSVALPAGQHVLKVLFNQPSQNLNWIRFTSLACTPESDAAFCTRLGKNCGVVSAPDNCGVGRAPNCGSCTAPQTCGGGGTPNVCGTACVPESDAAFCSRLGKNCGSLTGADNCGAPRTAGNCGSCTAPQTCGGAGTPNVCGTACVPESDAAFCERLGKQCGSFTGTDNCGAPRTAGNCGTCAAPNVCSANLCGPPPAGPSIAGLVVNDTSVGNDGIANNTQWSVQSNFGGGAGQRSFGDRTYTIGALSATAASNLGGKPWIRTAADSKTYATSSPPLASATVTGSLVYIAVDSRHATAFLTGAGYANQGFSLTVNEGTTARTYNVWGKSVVSGSTVNFPAVGASTAPCYFVIVK